MIDFKIQRGPSSLIFTKPGVINPRLIIEEGCWYLCTDTAELFLGVNTEDGLTLKRINEVNPADVPTDVPTGGEAARTIIDAFINEETGMLHLIYSDDTEDVLGPIVGKDGKDGTDGEDGTNGIDGKDGLTTAVKVNGVVYEHNNGVIELPDFITEHQSLEGLATEEYVNKKIAEAELADKEADLDAYYTKSEVDAKIPSLEGYAKTEDIPTDYLKESDLEGYSKFSGSYEDLTDKPEIPSVDGLATKEALQTVTTDVDALAITTTKERYEVIRVPGLEVIHRDDEIRLNTEHVELAPQNVGDGGESNAYYVGIKIYAPANAESIRQNVTSTPGIQEGKEIVPFTTTDVDSYGRKYSTIWVKCAVYQNGAWLNYGMNSTSAKCLGYYYSVEWYDNNGNIIENDSIHVVFTNDTCHYSNISDAVSRRFITVEEAIAAINIPETDLSNYYNKTETENLITEAIESIKHPTVDLEGYATEEWVNEQGFLKEHQDLSEYAKKTDLPSIEGLASEDFVRQEIAKIDIPEITETDLSAYSTTEQMTAAIAAAVDVKADNILFTTAKFVTTPIGGFISGESLKGLTIAELFAKLLGLVDSDPGEDPEAPDEPETPETFDSVAEKVESTEMSMYSVTHSGEVIAVPFKLIDSTAEPTESGFYAIKDAEGNITAAGYQDLSIDNDEVVYVVALPKEIDYNTMVDLYTWDPDEKVWVKARLDLSNDAAYVNEICEDLEIDISHIDTEKYTIWASEELCTGSIIRYNFKEEIL